VEWFPATFQKRALVKISESLGIEHADISVRGVSSGPIWLVFDDYADQIQLLVSAAKYKLRSLRFFAVSIDDFAHGPHARTLGEGGVHTIKTKPAREPSLIVKWLQDHQQPAKIMDINLTPEAVPLALYAVALNAIIAHAKACGIDLAQSRITPADDELRKIMSSAGACP